MWNDLDNLISTAPEEEVELLHGVDQNSLPEIPGGAPMTYPNGNEMRNERSTEVQSAEPGRVATKKRSRTTFSEEQVFAMENAFKHSKYLKKMERFELAKLLKLSEKNLMVWFQNRRQKSRKEKLNKFRLGAQMDKFDHSPSYNQQDINSYIPPPPHYNTYFNYMPPQYSDYYSYYDHQNIQPTQNSQMPEIYYQPLGNYPNNNFWANYSFDGSDQFAQYEETNSNTFICL